MTLVRRPAELDRLGPLALLAGAALLLLGFLACAERFMASLEPSPLARMLEPSSARRIPFVATPAPVSAAPAGPVVSEPSPDFEASVVDVRGTTVVVKITPLAASPEWYALSVASVRVYDPGTRTGVQGTPIEVTTPLPTWKADGPFTIEVSTCAFAHPSARIVLEGASAPIATFASNRFTRTFHIALSPPSAPR